MKGNILSKCCQCFTSQNQMIAESKYVKPCGMFHGKGYQEVYEELKEESEYKELKNYGLVSLIVKSGDDLR